MTASLTAPSPSAVNVDAGRRRAGRTAVAVTFDQGRFDELQARRIAVYFDDLRRLGESVDHRSRIAAMRAQWTEQHHVLDRAESMLDAPPLGPWR